MRASTVDLQKVASVLQLVKNPPANAEDTRDTGLIPGSGRSPGEGNDTPLQYSCLESPMDRGAWWATVNGVARSQIRLKQLSTPQTGGWIRPCSHSSPFPTTAKQKVSTSSVVLVKPLLFLLLCTSDLRSWRVCDCRMHSLRLISSSTLTFPSVVPTLTTCVFPC